MHRISGAVLAAALAFAPAAAMAQTPPTEAAQPSPAPRPMTDFLVNRPFVTNWNIWGLPNGPERRPDPGVTGGQALRVKVDRQTDPWTVGGVMPTNAAIRAGDVLFLAVWLRAVPAEGEDEAAARISLLGIEQKDTPDGMIASASNVTLNARWRMVYVSGVAPKDYAADQTHIVIHLAAQPQTVDVGPALLFDMGPDFDRAKLPVNSQP